MYGMSRLKNRRILWNTATRGWNEAMSYGTWYDYIALLGCASRRKSTHLHMKGTIPLVHLHAIEPSSRSPSHTVLPRVHDTPLILERWTMYPRRHPIHSISLLNFLNWLPHVLHIFRLPEGIYGRVITRVLSTCLACRRSALRRVP
jgi:hypothetical protein